MNHITNNTTKSLYAYQSGSVFQVKFAFFANQQINEQQLARFTHENNEKSGLIGLPRSPFAPVINP